MLQVLATVAGHEFGFVSDLFKKYDSISTGTLEELMAYWYWYGYVSAKSSNICRQMYTELTKAYLHLALIYYDGHANESVHCMASVFLAYLYCTTGHYQTAIDCCRVVIGRRKNNQNFAANKRQNVLNVDARLLSECFGDIATVTGFVSLYDYVKRKATSDSQQTHYDKSYCSVEALVRFIVAKCHMMDKVTAAKNAVLYDAMQHYRSYVVESFDNLFLADVLLFRLVEAICPQFDSQPLFRLSDLEKNLTGYDPNELCEILIRLAVERLTTFRQFEVDQFGSNCVVATTEFEALNAYRCRQYDRCLTLSRDIVNRILYMKRLPVGLIDVDGPQLALMDDDIASIVGLMHLVGHSQLRLTRIASQLAIALYLQIQCLLKLQRPVNFLHDALLRTRIAYRRHNVEESLSRWILAFIYRKATLYLSTFSGRT